MKSVIFPFIATKYNLLLDIMIVWQNAIMNAIVVNRNKRGTVVIAVFNF